MTEHVQVVHENCEREHCPICEGGLGFCSVCRSAEGEMPTECPGRVMTERECELVMCGITDFINGRWQAPEPRGLRGHNLSRWTGTVEEHGYAAGLHHGNLAQARAWRDRYGYNSIVIGC